MKILGFIGVDGCGKSSIVSSIKERELKSRIAHVHFRPGILAYRTKGINHMTEKISVKRARNQFISEFLVLYYLLDSFLGVLYYYFRGVEIVLWERPLIDLLVFPERYRLSKVCVTKPLIMLFSKLLFTILLSGDESLIYSRKKELNVDEIRHYNKLYMTTSPDLVLNVSLSVIEIRSLIYEAIGSRPC